MKCYKVTLLRLGSARCTEMFQPIREQFAHVSVLKLPKMANRQISKFTVGVSCQTRFHSEIAPAFVLL